MIHDTFKKCDMPRILALVAGFFGNADDDKEYTIEIKEKKKKRSLDANAYFWELAHKIAVKSGVEVSSVYRSYIREIGGNNEIVCVQEYAAKRFCDIWESRGIGWIAERMPSKLAGCVNVVCYYGSSTYNTAQMSRLIELAIQDCKEYGIEYLTPAELQELLVIGGDADA